MSQGFESVREGAAERFPFGTRVQDREDDDPDDAIVVQVAPTHASDWTVADGRTVADDNPDYPPGAPVVVVTFEDRLDDVRPGWRDREHYIAFDELADVGYYSFPAPRVEVVDEAAQVLDEEPEPVATTDAAQGDVKDTEAESEPDVEQRDPRGERADHADSEGGTEDVDGSAVPEPPEAVEALAEQLGDDGPAPIGYDEDDGHYAELEKLGETYHVQPGGKLLEGGDGALADRVREAGRDAG